jgi:hypothetical protein
VLFCLGRALAATLLDFPNRKEPFMPILLTAPEVLDREFLEVRARLLQIAASLDRLGRAEGAVNNDPRLQKIQQALAILGGKAADRAEQIQLVFSRPYAADWKTAMAMPKAR